MADEMMMNNEQQPKTTNPESYTAGMPKEGEQVNPELMKKIEGYVIVLVKLLHGEKTRGEVTDMLSASNDPFVSIPQAAVSINDMAVNMMEQGGIHPDLGVQLAASSYLLTDLLELGVAMGQWDKESLDKETIAGLYEDTLQIVIERGLEDGSIDPIQLQLDAEGQMTDEQRAAGNAFAQQTGTPTELRREAAIDQFARSKVNQARQMDAKKNAQKQALSMRGGQ